MAQKEVNTVLARPVGIAAGLLGLIQGLVWAVFSIMCICCYMGAITGDASGKEYYDLIYSIFLYEYSPAANKIVNSQIFFVFMCIYLPFVSVWTCLSGTMLWASIHGKWNLTKPVFGGWAIVTALISVEDIVFMGLIAADLHNNQDTLKIVYTHFVTYGIVMSIVARGYILWIVNVVFVGFTAKFAIDAAQSKEELARKSIINAYGNPTNGNPFARSPAANPWSFSDPNEGQNLYHPVPPGGNDNLGFERSQSFTPHLNPLSVRDANHIYANDVNYDNNNVDSNSNYYNSNYSHNDNNIPRLAKIGNGQGRRSPPINVPPPNVPYIPEPDYTPPGTPTGLKSVLKSKSNY